jgi:hypothetical protein
MAKEIILRLAKHEVMYIWEQISQNMKQMQETINNLTGPVNVHTEAQAQQLAGARSVVSGFQIPFQELPGIIKAGDVHHLELGFERARLQDALSLVTNEDTKANIRARIAGIPESEPYIVRMEREGAKMLLAILEAHVTHYQTQVIPGHDKMPNENFDDPCYTKEYWLALKKREKENLEKLRTTVSKELG